MRREGLQRAISKPFARLRRGEILLTSYKNTIIETELYLTAFLFHQKNGGRVYPTAKEEKREHNVYCSAASKASRNSGQLQVPQAESLSFFTAS